MKPNYLFKTRRQAIARARRKYGLKDFDGAIAEWDELLERNEEDALALLGRFDCLLKMEQKEEVLRIGDRVCELWPQSEAAHNNYACLLLENRQYEQACKHFDVALTLAPERNMYYFNAGLAYRGAHKLNQAADCFEQVLIREPEHERALEFLSQIYLEFGLRDKVIDLSMRLRMLRPGYALPLQRRVYCMMNDPEIAEQELNLDISLLRSVLVNRPAFVKKDGPLTIGWMVCQYSLPFLRYVMPAFVKYRDSSKYRLVAYTNYPMIQAADIESLFDEVHTVSSANVNAMRTLVSEHPADVLVDTVGQMPNNFAQLYSARLAPLQISWPFFQSHAELVLMDAALVDDVIHQKQPAGTSTAIEGKVDLSTKLVHLDTPQYCYDPDEAAAETSLPAATNGYVTFGVCADPIKINQQCIAAWAAIMNGTDGSKIALYHHLYPAPVCEQFLLAAFSQHGVDAERITFVTAPDKHEQRLAPYNNIDVLLSPFPLTDDMVLVDAMWMGVPALTMARDMRSIARARSIMTAALQTENLLQNTEDYIARGISLANDKAQLQNTRQTLRADLRNTSLLQAEQFVTRWLSKVESLL